MEFPNSRRAHLFCEQANHGPLNKNQVGMLAMMTHLYSQIGFVLVLKINL